MSKKMQLIVKSSSEIGTSPFINLNLQLAGNTDSNYLDLTGFTGITFRAWGSGRFNLQIQTKDVEEFGDYGFYSKRNFTLESSTWKTYTLYASDFVVESWTKAYKEGRTLTDGLSQVKQLTFNVSGQRKELNLHIDDIRIHGVKLDDLSYVGKVSPANDGTQITTALIPLLNFENNFSNGIIRDGAVPLNVVNSGFYSVEVYSLRGQLLSKESKSLAAGIQNVELPKGVEKGLYLLRISGFGQSVQAKWLRN